MNKLQVLPRLVPRVMTSRAMHATPATRAVSMKQPAEATAGKGGIIPATDDYKKFQEMQNIMLKDDGKLVWQKLPRDKWMTNLAFLLCFLGLISAVKDFYYLLNPPKE